MFYSFSFSFPIRRLLSNQIFRYKFQLVKHTLHSFFSGVQGIKDKKLKSTLKRQSQGARAAAYEAVRSEILLPEQAGSLEAEGMERTYHFTQAAIKDAVDVTASRKIFDLDLPQLGPYAMRYTRNGRHVLIGGRKGHVATFDWKTGNLGTF